MYRTSRAGRWIAKFEARRKTWNTTTTTRIGAVAKIPNPTMLTSGRKARASPTPIHFRIRPVRNTWVRSVSDLDRYFHHRKEPGLPCIIAGHDLLDDCNQVEVEKGGDDREKTD